VTSNKRQGSGIVIIGGFLGSGKTTLLRRFLEWEFAHGTRPQVIMSEFGDFDIDGAVIGDERLDLQAVTGGCVCCGSREELESALSGLIAASPGAPVYIEATGVADPAGVLAAIQPAISAGTAHVRKIVVVYDGSRHEDTEEDAILVERQLMAADVILLNKSDLVEDTDAVAEDLATVNPAATIIPTVNCEVTLEPLTEGVTAVRAGTENEEDEENYQSFAFMLDDRLARPALENWLAKLPAEVLRLKGFVRLEGENGLFEIQVVAGRATITPYETRRWHDAMLVAITRPMPAEELVAGLRACLPPD
jgi:G3E family GTPase